MKALHIIGGGDVGGAKVHVLSLVKELSAFMEVKIVSLRPGAFAEDAAELGIDVEVVKTGNFFSDIKKILKLIREENFELIHSHGAKANLYALATKKCCKIPIVTTVHSDYKLDYMHSLARRFSIGLANSIALRSFDYYVAVSSTFKKMLINRGFNPSKIFIIYNGIDFNTPIDQSTRQAFSQKYNCKLEQDDILVGIAARLNPVKGIDTLIDAASKVIKKNNKVKFLIGGDGEDSKALMNQAKNLGITDNVIFLGWLKSPYELMSIVDISVLTSISESFPYSILEGARCEKATISSRVGGIPDLIETGYNGYLFEPRDSDTLAEQLLELSVNHEKRHTFGKRLYEKTKNKFSLEVMRNRQLEIYQTILSQKKKEKHYDAIISGYYGFGNIGDDAMLRSIIDNLKKQKNDISIAVLSKCPEETAINYGVYAINRLNMFSVISMMRRAKLFIYGGGNIIQDSTSSRSLMFYLGTAWLASKLKLKVMFYANGIGPINKKLNFNFSRRILRNADVITVREHISYNELLKMGIDKSKIVLTADAALSVQIDKEVIASEICAAEQIPFNEKYAGFSVRRCPGTSHEEQDHFEKVMAHCADYVYEKYNLVPLFIPMEYPVDLNAIYSIMDKMKYKSYVLKEKHSVSEVFAIIKELKLMVSVRLHALIFAAYMNVPIIGISYQPKVDGFLEYINQPAVGNIKNLDIQKITNNIDNIIRNYEAIQADLEKSMEQLISKAHDNSKIAMELITQADH